MNIAGFVIRNALRNRRRLLLSVLSSAVSLFLLVMMMVLLRELTKPPTDAGSELRVAVRSKVSLANALPQRQLSIIEKVPGVEVVTPFAWIGGKFDENEQLPFGTIAVDPAKLRGLIVELQCDPAEYAAWMADRTTCIVGRDTMKQRNLKVGDRFTLTSGLYPCKLDMRIVGTYWGTIDDRNLFLHHKYLDEAMGDWGKTGMWWVKLTSADAMASVTETIEAAFVNSADEVKAESERAFQMSFVAMFGNIKVLLGGVCAAVVITLLLVTASTMSMSIRERFRELAVLKAIGFQRRELFAFILAESFGLIALGALIGAGGAWAFCTYAPVKAMSGGMFVSFEATSQILGVAALIACGLGIIASLAPAIAVARMSVVEGLKTLD